MSSDYRHSITTILNFDPPLSTPPSKAPKMPTVLTHSGAKKRDASWIASRPSPSLGSAASSSKRRRTTRSSSSSADTLDIEQVDLSNDDAKGLQESLRKQRVEQVKAQAPQADQQPTLATMTCVICMDEPTDLTATACGHLFCHGCLIEALRTGERNRRPQEAKRSQCPVCRKLLDRNKATDIIPLLMKKGKNHPRQVADTS